MIENSKEQKAKLSKITLAKLKDVKNFYNKNDVTINNMKVNKHFRLGWTNPTQDRAINFYVLLIDKNNQNNLKFKYGCQCFFEKIQGEGNVWTSKIASVNGLPTIPGIIIKKEVKINNVTILSSPPV